MKLYYKHYWKPFSALILADIYNICYDNTSIKVHNNSVLHTGSDAKISINYIIMYSTSNTV